MRPTQGWNPDDLHRSGCETNSYNVGECDCDGPTVLADLRESIAAAIDAAWHEEAGRDRDDGGYRDGILDGLERAEQIARETP